MAETDVLQNRTINTPDLNRATGGKWQPGQSGNPAGRPPARRVFAETLRAVGAETCQVQTPEGALEVSNLEAVARQLFAAAKSGDTRAARVIAERLDGSVTTVEEERRLMFWNQKFGRVESELV